MAVPERTAVALAVFAALIVSPSGCKKEEPDEDPGDGLVQPGDQVVGLQVRPAHLVLDGVTPFQLLCVGQTVDGYRAKLDDCAFEITDGAGVELDITGEVTPLEPGEVNIIAVRDELRSDEATVQVTPAGTLDVRVTRGVNGSPIAGAEVRVGVPDVVAAGTTGADGRVQLSGEFAGPVDLMILTTMYRDTILQGVQARNVTVALRDISVAYPRAKVRGEVTFTGEPEVGQMGLAVVLASTPYGPPYFSISDVMANDRNINEYGLNVDLPANVVIRDIADSYTAPIFEGEQVLSVAGGYFDLGEVLAIALAVQEQGASSVFNFVGAFSDRLQFGVTGPIDVPYETMEQQTWVDDVGLTLDLPLDREVAVSLPEPPEEFYSQDPPTVLSYRELKDDLGFVVTGMGVGLEPFSHPDADPPPDDDSADDDDSTRSEATSGSGSSLWNGGREAWEIVPVLESSADGGLGTARTIYGASAVYDGLGKSGDATMSFSPPMTGTHAVLPPFPALYEVPSLSDTPGHFAWEGPADVDAVRTKLYYRVNVEGVLPSTHSLMLDVYSPPGYGELQIPLAHLTNVITGGEDDRDPDSCDLEAVGLRGTNYQAMITDDGLDGLERFERLVNRRSLISRDFWASE